MDIKANQAERFLKAPPHDLVAVLFYGSDPGHVSERAAILARHLADDPKDPGEILRIDEADLATNPDRLGIELRTLPMFGGRKIVRLRAEQRLKPELIADILGGSALAGVLIVEGGNLKPDSKLRSLFASAPSAAAVACYPDDEKSLGVLIGEIGSEHSLTLPAEVRGHLAALLGADRTQSRNELEKLALYVGSGATVTLDDVDAVVGDASELGLDQIAHAVAAGRAREALAAFDRAESSGESPQSVILALLRYFMRLHTVAAATAGGKPFDAVIRTLRPPLHFKAEPLIRAALRLWSLSQLSLAIALIQRAARASRLSGHLEREIAERLLLDLSQLAKGNA